MRRVNPRWWTVPMVVIGSLVAGLAVAAPGDIQTLAGSGRQGNAPDGVYAASAFLTLPDDALVAPNGDVFIADASFGRVRKVDHRTGVMTRIAGAGQGGDYDSHGDGVLAVDAFLRSPNGLAFDGDGNLLIADASLHRVFRIDAVSGRIETIAGTGELGMAGDGGPATEAQLAAPARLALDFSGNLLIVELQNNQVRRVSAQDGTISTLFSGPPFERITDLAVSALGDVFIADFAARRVWQGGVDGGPVTAFAGNGDTTSSGDGGPPLAAGLEGPRGLAIDHAGRLFIATQARIRRVEFVTTSHVIETVAGVGFVGFGGDGGPAVDAVLHSPSGMSLDGHGDLYFADVVNNRVRMIEGLGSIRTGTLSYQATGEVLEVPNGQIQEGAPVVLTAQVTFRPEQTWMIESSYAGGERFRGIGNQCLRPGLPNGQGVVQMQVGPCVGPSTVWLTGNSSSLFTIRKAAPNTCLGPAEGSPGTPRPVVFQPCANAPIRGWLLSPQTPPAERCLPNDRRLCLNNGRFAVEVDWRLPSGDVGTGIPVVERTDDSGLLYFFNPTNWEILVKVLDNCDGPSNRYWVFAAASTTLEYTLRVTDTRTGDVRTYFNPQGNRAAAIADTEAFATCP